jgi:hypothetical protein
MHEAPKEIRRRIIPRWRRVSDTPSEELTSIKQSEVSVEFRREFETLRAHWLARKDVVSASELLFAASLGFSDNSVHQAAQFLIDAPGVSSELRRLAMGKLPTITQTSANEIEHEQTFEIRTLKRKLVDQPRNAIAHLELARAYVSVGLTEKANRHIRVAIQLAPQAASYCGLRRVLTFIVARSTVP